MNEAVPGTMPRDQTNQMSVCLSSVIIPSKLQWSPIVHKITFKKVSRPLLVWPLPIF